MNKTRKLTVSALLAALAIVLSTLEGMLVIIPQVPGVKLGLSNIAVMFALFFMDSGTALTIGILKSLFALLTRGAVAGLLSLSGGMASIIVMIIIMKLSKNASTAVISTIASISHNLAQFAVISLIYAPMSMLPYLPVLLASGTVFGVINGIFLHGVKPALSRLLKGEK